MQKQIAKNVKDPVSLFIEISLNKVKYHQAVAIIEARLSKRPNNLDLLFQLANVHSIIGKQHVKAIKIYKQILIKNPEFHSASYNLIVSLLKLKKYKQAHTLAKKLVLEEPSIAHEKLLKRCKRNLK